MFFSSFPSSELWKREELNFWSFDSGQISQQRTEVGERRIKLPVLDSFLETLILVFHCV